MNDSNSLAHTKWNCKYHVVFAPKYRRKVFYREKRREIGAEAFMSIQLERMQKRFRSTSSSSMKRTRQESS